MSVSLSYVEGTSEKLRCILRSYKIRFAIYTENYFVNEWLCRKKKILDEIECCTCTANLKRL